MVYFDLSCSSEAFWQLQTKTKGNDNNFLSVTLIGENSPSNKDLWIMGQINIIVTNERQYHINVIANLRKIPQPKIRHSDLLVTSICFDLIRYWLLGHLGSKQTSIKITSNWCGLVKTCQNWVCFPSKPCLWLRIT